MQNVFVEKPYQFIPRFKTAWPQRLFFGSGLFKRTLKKREGVVKHECRHIERLQNSIAAGHGVLLTPNHPRTADPMAMCHIAKEAKCGFYCMASWHLFNISWFSTWAIRINGAFSVNREGLDKKAVEQAIEILQTAERPLIIFPEGTTSRTNDRLMSLMEGPSFIARTAAKRRLKNDGGKVVVHPIGIKYVFEGDIDQVCDEVLTDLEHRLSWRPQSERVPLLQRLLKVGNAMLTLKELEHDASVSSDATLRDRQTNMVNHLLNPLEQEWIGSAQIDSGIAVRIKNLRMKIFPEMSRQSLTTEERWRRWSQLEETYLAQQIDCYPDNYVYEHPSVDRILETVEKFEEDLTDSCRIHGNLKVILDVGEAIEVSPKRDKTASEDPLMKTIRERLESNLAELQSESQMYETGS